MQRLRISSSKELGHHLSSYCPTPDLKRKWGKATVCWCTHAPLLDCRLTALGLEHRKNGIGSELACSVANTDLRKEGGGADIAMSLLTIQHSCLVVIADGSTQDESPAMHHNCYDTASSVLLKPFHDLLLKENLKSMIIQIWLVSKK